MAEKTCELEAEYELESFIQDSDKKAADEYVVKQPSSSVGEVVRQGTAVLRGTARCGKISYFLHWDPPAVQGVCELHNNDCYATWPLTSSPDEHIILEWIANGPSFKSAEDHMKTLPRGWYNHRRRPKPKAATR